MLTVQGVQSVEGLSVLLSRVKAYLRSIMSQPRLNNHMLLYVHNEPADAQDVANYFTDHRKTVFQAR